MSETTDAAFDEVSMSRATIENYDSFLERLCEARVVKVYHLHLTTHGAINQIETRIDENLAH